MKNNMIPQLRFPEFEGEWGSNKLGTIATFSKGKGISKSEIDENGTTECIRYGELYTTYSEVITEILSKTNLDGNELILSEENDVIIPASGETQIDIATASCVTKSGVALGGDLNIIKSKIDGIFLSYYLNNARKKSIARLAQGISVVHLYASQLSTLTVNTPSLPEQTKIATFLTAVDKRINLLQKKKANLEQYKKGVMQKLFNGEWKIENGKRVFVPPTFRFRPDKNEEDVIFNSQLSTINYKNWEVKKLGKIANITTGNSNRQDSGLDGEYTFFDRSEDIRTSSIYLFDGEAVIVAGEGSDFVPKYFIGKFDLHQRTYAIMNFKNTDGKFLFYYIHYFRKYFLSQAVGSTVKSLRLPMFQKMPINLPTIEEQQKIANFLSSIDKAIEITDKQIEQTQQWKKGLLQKMFT